MRLLGLQTAPAQWILDHLPAWSLHEGFYGLALWQWIILPIAALLSLVAGALVTRLLGRVAVAFATAGTPWDGRALKKSRGPLTLLVALGVARSLVPTVGLSESANETALNALVATLLFGIFWSLWRLVDLMAARYATSPRVLENSGARSLLSIGSKSAKVVLFLMGAITALGHLGVHIATLVTGLGIGGLAFALAAQKTLENFFGSVTLGVDRPLAIGDTVKIDDFTAAVEQIGLRSTRFRTADETVITIPNGRLADMRIENISQRTRIRLATKVALAYDTEAAVVLAIIAEMRAFLTGRDDVEAETVSVALVALAEWSLTIEINAWFKSTSLDAFQAFRQEALLGLIGITEKHGASVAYPTRTVRVARPSSKTA